MLMFSKRKILMTRSENLCYYSDVKLSACKQKRARMARPRKDSGELAAVERIGRAFWDCMELSPFDAISLADITKGAAINHNTFYYHYENLESFAREAVDATLEPGFVTDMLAVMFNGSFPPEKLLQEPDYESRFRRVQLIARNGSAEHRETLKSRMLEAARGLLGLDGAGCDGSLELTLEFVIGGTCALLGSELSKDDPVNLLTFSPGELGQAVAGVLLDLRG